MLHDLVKYAELTELPEIRNHCQLAYETAVEEVGGASSAGKRSLKMRHFVDAIRDLIDYAETANLPKTRSLLIQALASAADHLNSPALTRVVVPFPGKDRR